jgi:hypothetical protein
MHSASSTEYWLAGKLMYSAAGASKQEYISGHPSTSGQGEIEFGESKGGRRRVPSGRSSCLTEMDSERQATKRALGPDDGETADDEGDEEEDARTTAPERRKETETGGVERRDAAIGVSRERGRVGCRRGEWLRVVASRCGPD